MGTDVSPRDGALGGLARSLVSWTVDSEAAGLRQSRAARAERERG
jgi:hypothetical protein